MRNVALTTLSPEELAEVTGGSANPYDDHEFGSSFGSRLLDWVSRSDWDSYGDAVW
jgi:hypothetical protein